MKVFAWTAVAAMGFGMMLLAYSARHRPDSQSPWEHGVIVIGPEAHKAKVAAEGGCPTTFPLARTDLAFSTPSGKTLSPSSVGASPSPESQRLG